MSPMAASPRGLASAAFGESYRAFGEILHLPRTGLQLIKRPIREQAYDLTGVYPYALCVDWSGLNQDIDELRDRNAASVVFVADPFQADAVQKLTQNWSLSRHFKTHYVVDLTQDWRQGRRKEVRRTTRRALELYETGIATDPISFAPTLWDFYQTTIRRKRVTGIQRLSLDTIEQQLAVPGAVLITAHDAVGLAGATLFFDHGATVTAHLMFLSERAVHNKATYALIFAGLEECEKRGCCFVNLGGATGTKDDLSDGVARFKKRWTENTRSAWICGSVLNATLYQQLERESRCQSASYFPSYRASGSRIFGATGA